MAAMIVEDLVSGAISMAMSLFTGEMSTVVEVPPGVVEVVSEKLAYYAEKVKQEQSP